MEEIPGTTQYGICWNMCFVSNRAYVIVYVSVGGGVPGLGDKDD